MFFQNIVFRRLFFLTILFSMFTFSFLGEAKPAYSSKYKKTHKTRKNKSRKIKAPVPKKFPDNYSPLDKNKTVKVITEELIESTIEASRQRYLKGLIRIQRGDTLGSIRYFELALEGLNKLVSYPEIDDNKEFLGLSKSIIRDYEKYSSKVAIDSDEGLNMFISKDRLFEEALTSNDETTAAIKHTVTPVQKHDKYVFKLPSPDELMIYVPDNKAIDKQINFLIKGRGYQFILGWLKRSGRWYNMMSDICEKEGMPLEIIVLSMIESAYNPIAVSPRGAVGLWQFLYSTGLDYGLNKHQSIWVDERRDPIKSTRAGLRYLRDMYLEFNDWHLALAAYNWGWGNVRRALRQTNLDKPTYWDLRTKKNIHMPRETRNYVPLFLALVKILSNPAAYGIDVKNIDYDKEFLYDEIEIKQAANLTAIATAIGVGVQEIRDLNPELLYDITPPNRKYYRLRVPLGSSTDFVENFYKLPIEERQPYLMHRVKKGEDVISISEKYDVAIDELIYINNLNKKSILLTANTELRIPIGGKNYSHSTLVLTSSGLKEKTETVANNPNYHIVGVGESVYSVAAKYKISTANLRNWNKLPIDEEILKEGTTLVISKAEAERLGTGNTKSVSLSSSMLKNLNKTELEQESNSTKNKSSVKKKRKAKKTTYKVKSGDNLSVIADRHNCSVRDLKLWNNLKNNNLRVGQVLVLSAKSSKSKKKSNKVKSKRRKSNNTKIYTVRKGDNLYSIARKFNMKLSDLLRKNKKINPDRLQIGQKIKIR